MGSFFANSQRKFAAFRKRNSKIRHYFPGWALKYVGPFNYKYAQFRKLFIPVKHKSNNVNLYHCTQAKCGSVWISQLLRDPMVYKYSGMIVSQYIDKFDISQMEPVTHITKPYPANTIVSSFKRSYTSYISDLPKNEGNNKAFYIMRDPRDIIVSWYFSMKKTHVAAPNTAMKIIEHRDFLNKVSMEEGLKYGIDTYIEEGKFEVSRNWVKEGGKDPNVMLLRFEDLVAADHKKEFKKLFDFLDIKMDPKEFNDLIRDYSFKKLTGRKVGEEDVNSHVRSGSSGDWKRYFTPSIQQYFTEKTGSLIADLGYES